MDQGILQVQRRHAKREIEGEDALQELREHERELFPSQAAKDEVEGYKNFAEVGRDMERLLDVVWISGTRRLSCNHIHTETSLTLDAASLQIPYLLTIALLTANFLPSYPPAPKVMFRLLGKLDIAFASLLQGRNVETGDRLPGFETGRRVSGTEKVRIKSLVERTRVAVVEVMSSGEMEEDEEQGTDAEESELEDGMVVEMETDTENEQSRREKKLQDEVEDVGGWDMEVAKVYDRTVVELGDTIGGTPIGIITDD